MIAVMTVVWIIMLGFSMFDVLEAWLGSLERKFDSKHCSARCAEDDEDDEDEYCQALEERRASERGMFRKG